MADERDDAVPASPTDHDPALDRATAILDEGDERPSPDRLAAVTALGERIVEQLKTVFDPEIPVNIYELGLVYKIDIDDENKVSIDMTLTSPACPVAESLPGEVELKVNAVEGVNGTVVNIVWDPPWTPQMMSEEAQLELGMIY
ncbi:FeS assembly SUF system protein [Arboricoccus pini]|uniref:FeS assembly SUF system protein n=1 Tax=Arboricoccus pini TaxID=1963835 RepID=A0A212QSH6_9PROT|nr:SUF system Fe-S cluster assembly protein [Arboricoccus pini]SNB62379.1 FeS assembly SUF system protein [Arboricoccus pini]